MCKLVCSVASYVLPMTAIFLVLSRGLPSVATIALTMSLTMLNIGVYMSVILHRFFSHTAFKTSRGFQFVLALYSCLAFQGGPIWWASKHRRHHAHCDTKQDPHSWAMTSHWYAWWGWTLSPREQRIDREYVENWLGFPELVLLDNMWIVVPTLLTVLSYYALGFHDTVAFVTTPMFLSRMITLLFNCEYHPPPTPKTCKSIDNPRILAELVGESHHDDHHTHPRRLRRPGLDLPYWIMIVPLLKSGLIWSA